MSGPTALEIASWAEARAARANGTSPLSRAEQYQIVQASKRAGMTLEKLAREFGRSDVEVGRVLADWTDTTGAAKELLKARALELADRMMTEADPGVALEVLERLRVVESTKSSGPAFTVQIGIDASEARLIGPDDPRYQGGRPPDVSSDAV